MLMYLPIAIVVLSNIIYHVCAKSTPESINPFASIIITYLIGAIAATAMYFILNRGGNLLNEFKHINWTTIVLGIAIVGLEVGNIYMYKVGWSIGTGQIVQAAILAICLIIVGVLFYKEQVSFSKLFGIAICLLGLYFINK